MNVQPHIIKGVICPRSLYTHIYFFRLRIPCTIKRDNQKTNHSSESCYLFFISCGPRIVIQYQQPMFDDLIEGTLGQYFRCMLLKICLNWVPKALLLLNNRFLFFLARKTASRFTPAMEITHGKLFTKATHPNRKKKLSWNPTWVAAFT